jgi:hypothetical protein
LKRISQLSVITGGATYKKFDYVLMPNQSIKPTKGLVFFYEGDGNYSVNNNQDHIDPETVIHEQLTRRGKSYVLDDTYLYTVSLEDDGLHIDGVSCIYSFI